MVRSWLTKFMRELKERVIRVKKSPFSIIGASIIVFYIIVALLAPILAPPGHPSQAGDPFKMPRYGFSEIPKPPNADNPFGTTRGQYDIYYGCIWGTVTAFRLGLSILFGALAIGLVIGSVAGYFGGIVDELLMRFTDIFLSLPSFIFAMAIVVTWLPMGGMDRLNKLVTVLILVGWASYARIVRDEIFRIKYEAAVRKAVKPSIPNLLCSILTRVVLDIGPIVLTVATFSFLLLGAPFGYTEWGHLIALAVTSFTYMGYPLVPSLSYWYTFIIPGLFLFTFVLGWNLLGDALRDTSAPPKCLAARAPLFPP